MQKIRKTTLDDILHDLINPLTSINLLLHAGEEKHPETQKCKSKIDQLTHSIAVILGIKNDGTISQSDIQNCIECMYANTRRKNISFVTIGTLHDDIQTNSTYFYKSFLKMMINSIDAHPGKHKSRIIVSIQGEKDTIVISVEDFIHRPVAPTIHYPEFAAKISFRRKKKAGSITSVTIQKEIDV